ncbi:MAG: MotA/TolQ/ExbB proton channel family protein [SAR324 cluster bacterium]|nr:MotA/TolQ/ExbB proton channel family protein [SAR324 cluster bacterium]
MFESFWQILEKGGVMMLPLGLASLIALAIILERVYSLWRSRVFPEASLESWTTFIQRDSQCESKGQSEQGNLIDEASAETDAISKILNPLIPHLPLPVSRLEERFSDLSRKVKNQFEQSLVLLDTIAGVAPLLGLLGTALGMIRVFAQLSTTGAAKMEALSAGISEALFTTVTGLCIGIPALIAANLLSRHIDNLMLLLEDQLNQLLDENYDFFVRER